MKYIITLLLVLTSFSASAAPIAQSKTWTAPTVQCAGGLWAQVTCPAGYEYVPAGVIFSENFDSMADYMPLSANDSTTVPEGWDAVYQTENWHPASTTNAKANMYINDEQPYGGSGKAFLNWAESNDGGSGWASDGQIVKDFTPSSNVYFKLKIKFQDGWASDAERGNSKLFRIGHFDGGTDPERFAYFGTGNSAPMYIFNWEQSDYGVRHNHSIRCDPQETNYYCGTPAFTYPYRAVSQGSMSVNHTSDVTAFTPTLDDLVNGGSIPTSGTATHNQVYGSEWHTLEFYVEMNSSAGVSDGKLRYWLDGQKLIESDAVPWIGDGGDINALWNYIELGGNDYYHWNIVNDAFATDKERWFVIDDVEVRNSLPEGLSL